MSENIQKIVRDSIKESRKTAEKYEKESRERIEKLEESGKDLDLKSMKNFANWRDYLHKYYVIILAFVGGSGIFTSVQGLGNSLISWGIYLALGGIFIGFLSINIYFYLERRWFQISHYVTTYGLGKMGEHPEAEGDIVRASRLNLSAKIKEFKEQLETAEKKKGKSETKKLKKLIRGHKRERRLMKYLGQQFGFIEYFWIVATAISFFLTSVGVVMIFIAVL